MGVVEMSAEEVKTTDGGMYDWDGLIISDWIANALIAAGVIKKVA